MFADYIPEYCHAPHAPKSLDNGKGLAILATTPNERIKFI
jgi:hypothetical protein